MQRKWNTGFFRRLMVRMGIIKKSSYPKIAPSSFTLYRSIEDLPMWNFRKVISTGDIRYLYILEYYKDLPKEHPKYEKWDDIFWEYIEAKGVDNNFKLRLELKAKLAILENEEICKGKKNGVKIMMVNEKLKSLQNNTKKNTDLGNDAVLSKYLGFLINPKTTTVSQYIGFEQLLTESNKNVSSNNR